jgi:hypothetical protein
MHHLAGLSEQLGWEGSLEEFGKRLCNVAVTLCELHWRALEQEQRRLQLLQLVSKGASGHVCLCVSVE